MKTQLMELRGITKQYPGVLALNNVSVSFKQGEVHALLGENGAGKSTLIKVLSGAIEPNDGQIVIDSKSYDKMTPALSQELGIGVIYQEFNLVPSLSIAENIFLGNEIRNGILVDKKKMLEKAKELLAGLDIHDVDPSTRVRELSVAYQQIVEIAKAVSKNVRILVMDEPTAPLSSNEVEAMFALVRKLVEKKVTIIYISHRMEEIFELADRVTVMRDGGYIATKNTKETNKDELVGLMVGRPLTEQYPARNTKIGEVVLDCKGVCAGGFLKDINLTVRSGEILGISGLVGAGRTELARVIFAADAMQAGEIRINGKKVACKTPRDAIANGIALIPEDRKQQGLLMKMSVGDNITFSSIKRISNGVMLDKKKEKSIVSGFIEKLRIKTPSQSQIVKNLSGGNQQKVVLAKWLASDSKVYIFDEPTRGIDVGAKYEIYTLMNELAAQGNAIIMISSDMPEILGMSDRIVVMYDGRIAGELDRSEASQSSIITMASGFDDIVK